MIANCGKGESGYSGQTAGDQTGKEWRLISWFNCSWQCVLRHPDGDVRSLIAELAKEGANNDNIGYDQTDRLTFWQQLKSSGYHPANITTKCEADCSSSTASIVKAVGYLTNNEKLKNVSESLTTYYMRSAFIQAGFECLTESKYISSDSYLVTGDVILNDSQHVAIEVSDGTYGQQTVSAAASTTATTESTSTSTTSLMLGSTGTAVKEMQDMLIKLGYSCGVDGADGDFGQNTMTALINFQKNRGLTADGIYGAKSKEALVNAYVALYQTDTTSEDTTTESTSTESSSETSTGTIKITANDPWKPTVGTVVMFTGSKQHITSNGGFNLNAKSGLARVTAINIKGRYPYHLLGTGFSATVAGWVAAEDIRRRECDDE